MASTARGERRQQQLTRRCAWCDTIEVDGTWRLERRDPPPPAGHGAVTRRRDVRA
jgi:hypothetical protein